MSYTTDPKQWAANLKAIAESTKGGLDQVVRRVSLEIFQRVILKSPVGNPELWAANAHAVRVNTSIADYNARLRENRSNRDSRGRLIRGRMRAVQRGTTVAKLTLPAGTNYSGGRFRGSWVVSIGAPKPSPQDRIDPTGAAALAEAQAVIGTAEAGSVIYITSNLPYSLALEYGHSKQAPSGVVRVTVAEAVEIVREAAAATRSRPQAD